MIGEDGVRRIDGKEVVLASNMTNTGMQKKSDQMFYYIKYQQKMLFNLHECEYLISMFCRLDSGGVYLVGSGDSGASLAFLTLGLSHFIIITLASLQYRVPQLGWKPTGWTPPPTQSVTCHQQV